MYLFQFTILVHTPVYSAYLRRVYVRPRLLLSYSEVSCAVQHTQVLCQYR